MGREIEAKILLSEEEYKDLKCNNNWTEVHNKSDLYYSKYGSIEEGRQHGEPITRIRNEDYKCFFTLKKKTIENGVEINQEDETEISDVYPIEQLLLDSGYGVVFRKSKHSLGKTITISKHKFHVELEIINQKVYALEIECTEGESSAIDVRTFLFEAFKYMGIENSEERFEHRSWMDIIKEAK